jgi:hypothetical protein
MGMATVFIVIFFTRRKQRKEQIKEVIKFVEIEKAPPAKEIRSDSPDSGAESTHSGDGGEVAEREKLQLHAEPAIPVEAETTEIYEMPAVEPVGSELNTPMDARRRLADGEEEWPVSPRTPMPMSPLPLLFAMTELRDQRNGGEQSPRHDTFYHP